MSHKTDKGHVNTVFITGVSRGNGRAFAQKFLDAGWLVIGTSIDGSLPFPHNNLRVYQLDISKPKQIKTLTAQFFSDHTKIDLLINNAGINLSSATEFPTKTVSMDTLRKTLAVNLVGLIDLTERLVPYVRPGGQIVNISSGAGAFHPFIGAGSSSYQISKAALNMYTVTLAGRLKETGVLTWSFDPGWVRTDMGGPDAPKSPEEAANELFDLVTSRRPSSGTFWLADRERDW